MEPGEAGRGDVVLTSSERILTTHTGSLPRPAGVALPGTEAAASGDEADREAVSAAVAEIVRHQVEAGVDVVNDGEMSKPSYSTYVTNRLTGFDPEVTQSRVIPGAEDFPEFFARVNSQNRPSLTTPVCTGPIIYKGQEAADLDMTNLRAAADATGASQIFMTAASPGVIAQFMANRYYPSHDEYIWALAKAMKQEYETVWRAGFVLQLDCPDLGCWPNYEAQGMTKAEYLDMCAVHVDAINHATAAIPPESMRMHVCWGNYEGPHNRDIPLREIIRNVLRARPCGLLFEGANPRHEHEWIVLEDVELPEGKVLSPGVLDSTTNYIEHPELVAQRIERYARIVGMESIMVGSDCGFATSAQSNTVDPRIAWAKIAAMAEGAAIATRRLTGAA